VENSISEQKIADLRAYPVSYRLQRLRWWHNLTQQDFADLVGCSRTSVSAWEKGQRFPSGQNLMNIARIYDLPGDFFVDVNIETFKPKKRKKG